MFSHKWGLNQAVIDGTKPTTLRIIPEKTIKACKDPANPFDYPDPAKLIAAAPYKVGDLVAVAEAYQDIFSPLDWVNRELYRNEPGWKNKMYVSADLMRYFIGMQRSRPGRPWPRSSGTAAWSRSSSSRPCTWTSGKTTP